MQNDSESGDFSLLGLLGSAVSRVKALGGVMHDNRNEQNSNPEQLKSDIHEENTAGISAETCRARTLRPIAADYKPPIIYNDDDVRREVFDEENGPDKMRNLAQAEKDVWAFRDRDHLMERSGRWIKQKARLAPSPVEEEREMMEQLNERVPTGTAADFQAELQRHQDDVDDKYKIPTTRSKVGRLAVDCSSNVESGFVDAFSAAPGAGERYREACADLKDALKKVDIAVQQNREGTYVPRATVERGGGDAQESTRGSAASICAQRDSIPRPLGYDLDRWAFELCR